MKPKTILTLIFISVAATIISSLILGRLTLPFSQNAEGALPDNVFQFGGGSSSGEAGAGRSF